MTQGIIREKMEFDIVIVGAGPAGLSAAIRLAELNKTLPSPLSIGVLEKGAYVGAHILSGAVLDPSALNELLPDWQTQWNTSRTPVTQDLFWLLSATRSWSLPQLPTMNNQGNFMISLGQLCQWLASQAESLGVNIFPGFPASALILADNKVIGVQTQDTGLNPDGSEGKRFQPGIELYCKQLLLAEGCRGSLSEQVIERYQLRGSPDLQPHINRNINPQSYAIGVKELWEINPKNHKPGMVIHSVGWPLDSKTYGGSFIYHWGHNKLAIGMVIGLDYPNPTLDPFGELQRLKLHPKIKAMLEDGQCIEYGSRALNEGGWQSVPKLSFPGGMLIGCSAGFVNVAKIKGIHNAMYSGIYAANQIAEQYSQLNPGIEFSNYDHYIRQSRIMRELYTVRNIRPAFHYGLWSGLAYTALDQYILRGHAPWTFNFTPDYKALKSLNQVKRIDYPSPNGQTTFAKLTQLSLSGTRHQENQPCHLQLKNPTKAIEINYQIYGSPEQYYCPAAVYEIVEEPGTTHGNSPRLQINFSNCLHCKTCDIKDPTQNIIWTTPYGGDGPNYSQM